MILYLKYSKDSTKKLLDRSHIFNKIEGYEANIQNPVAFWYINNEPDEKEIRKAILFTITLKYLNAQ
jgi:hypothetical protein